MDPSPTISTNDFNTLNATISKLGTLIRDMVTRMNTNGGPGCPVQASQAAAELIPLIMVVAANGTSIVTPTSLHTCFPNIEVAVIMAIIMHEFKVANFHKLDPTNWDKEVAYTFYSMTNQFKISNCSAKEYKNSFSIIVPLQHYFNVLGFHLPKVNNIPFSMNMAAGNYSGWGVPATDLLSKHVYAYRKAMPGKQSRAAVGVMTHSLDPCTLPNKPPSPQNLPRCSVKLPQHSTPTLANSNAFLANSDSPLANSDVFSTATSTSPGSPEPLGPLLHHA
ncbi:hypothetical protein H2248_005639 [Termitomyces sp. 'cryptogamus']|nr:hypothetical protein H2248_005639 [Termitomyces sp. 'cryptogamus']